MPAAPRPGKAPLPVPGKPPLPVPGKPPLPARGRRRFLGAVPGRAGRIAP